MKRFRDQPARLVTFSWTLYLLGLRRAFAWIHDSTIPIHLAGTGRG